MIAARIGAFVALLVTATAAAEAQPVGTFRWRLEPYCNVLTLSITRSGEVYRLDGADDQCGGEKASIVGTASVASGGDIGLGMSIVTTPGAVPVHLRAAISLSSLSGTWQDSAGNAGAFVPTATTGSGDNPRPASRLGAMVITPSTVQRRISGSCPGGQYIAAIAEDGRVSCTTAGGGTITRVLAGTGLYGVGGTQTVSLYFRPESIESGAGVIARSTLEPDGTGPISGQGGFFAWHARKGAVRAGRVLFFPGQWDDRNTGHYSVGLGRDARADGDHSTAIGEAAIADGQYSVALVQGYATGVAAVAIGRGAARGARMARPHSPPDSRPRQAGRPAWPWARMSRCRTRFLAPSSSAIMRRFRSIDWWAGPTSSTSARIRSWSSSRTPRPRSASGSTRGRGAARRIAA